MIACAHRGCDNTFPPNAYGSEKKYCSRRCAAQERRALRLTENPEVEHEYRAANRDQINLSGREYYARVTELDKAYPCARSECDNTFHRTNNCQRFCSTDCRKIVARKRWKTNGVDEYRKKWARAHPEIRKASLARYRAANKEQRAAEAREWQRAHPEAVKGYDTARRARANVAVGRTIGQLAAELPDVDSDQESC